MDANRDRRRHLSHRNDCDRSRLLDDPDAAKRNLKRVIDESSEDDLYPATMFVAIDIPQEVEKTFKKTS